MRKIVLRLWGSLFFLAVCGATAGAQTVQGAHFDPTPVRLDRAETANKRPVTSMDLLTLRDPKGVSISPDGKWVAFVVGQAVYETNAYRSGIFVVSAAADHRLKALGTAGRPQWDDINQWSSEDPQWSSDSRVIWYRARMEDGQNCQVWRWDVPSTRRKQVTRVPGDVESYRLVSGGQMLFLTVAKHSVSTKKQSFYEPAILFPGPIQPYQSIPVTTQMRLSEVAAKEYWIHDVRTNRERPAKEDEIEKWKPAEPLARRGLAADQALKKYHLLDAAESSDREHIAFRYVTDDPLTSPTAAWRLLLWSSKTHTARELTPDVVLVDQYWWNEDGSELYFARRNFGHSHELWMASADGSSVQLIFRPEQSDYLSSFSSDRTGQLFACTVENNTTPPQIALLNRSERRVRVLARLNPAFDSLERSPGDRIEGTNKYGDGWYGYLVRPLGFVPGKRYPLIVTTYRTGDYFLRGASGDQNPIQVYAANGFAVLSFDVGPIRNIRPGHFEEKLQDWASPTASLQAAVAKLADQGIIDPSRVGIAGFSHGEEIAGYAVTHTNLFHAATGAAMYEPCFYFIGGTVWWNQFEAWGLGGWPGGASKAHWEEIAMASNAPRIDTPILETVSDTEYLIYMPLYRSLADLGKPVELRIYPNELHVRNQPRHRFEIYELNLDWFSFWLKGEERPGKEMKEQYLRWRQMRDHKAQELRPAAVVGN